MKSPEFAANVATGDAVESAANEHEWRNWEPVRAELVRQMRERASFADTSASLSRLLQTWADVLDGKDSCGWAAMNRADLQNAKESNEKA